jgi:hypothetical protein
VKDIDRINLEFWGEDYAPRELPVRCTVAGCRASISLSEEEKRSVMAWVVEAAIASTLKLDTINFRRIN